MIGATVAIVAFVLGSVVAIGIPATVFILGRREWRRTPSLGIMVKGEGPPDDLLEMAAESFISDWGEHFGRETAVARAIRALRVEWLQGDSFLYKDARTGKESKLTGLMVTPRYVIVCERGGLPIGRLSLLHELGHVALAATGASPAHEDWPDGLAEMISELEARFAS